MYASEEEVSKLCEKFAQALSKNHDYIDYMDIMSENGLPYMVQTYHYQCFSYVWDIAQREYGRIHPHLRGYMTTDSRLRHVNILSTEEVWCRQQLFIAELRAKNGE